ncbi:hypothetical protein, partial [Pluralibacter gergoviae]|uniref:hypothetical protein n=1 Tax=Pluralibacter gergoviae TaxID=61647 RepID=UPI002896C775
VAAGFQLLRQGHKQCPSVKGIRDYSGSSGASRVKKVSSLRSVSGAEGSAERAQTRSGRISRRPSGVRLPSARRLIASQPVTPWP